MVEFRRETPEGVTGTEFTALDGGGVVYVDTALTEDIESEGYAREVIRRIQEMRKDLELDVEERIDVDLTSTTSASTAGPRARGPHRRGGPRRRARRRRRWPSRDLGGRRNCLEIAIAPCEADQREASEQASGD